MIGAPRPADELTLVQPFGVDSVGKENVPGQFAPEHPGRLHAPPSPNGGQVEKGGMAFHPPRPPSAANQGKDFEEFVRMELTEINRKLDKMSEADAGRASKQRGASDRIKRFDTFMRCETNGQLQSVGDTFKRAGSKPDAKRAGSKPGPTLRSASRQDANSWDVQDVTASNQWLEQVRSEENNGGGATAMKTLPGKDVVQPPSGQAKLLSQQDERPEPAHEVDTYQHPRPPPSAGKKLRPSDSHYSKSTGGPFAQGLMEIAQFPGSDEGGFLAAKSTTCDEDKIVTSDSMANFFKEQERKQVKTRKRVVNCGGALDIVWNFLENPDSGPLAMWFGRFMTAFIIMTVFVTLLQTMEPHPPLSGAGAAVLETFIDVVFLTEFVLRFASCPNQKMFFVSGFNMIDLAAAIPFIVRAHAGFVVDCGPDHDGSHSFLLLWVPIIRLMKTLRRFEKLQLLVKAFYMAFEALPVLLFMIAMIGLLFSVLVFLVEPRSNLASLPDSIWLTLVTMTTVGYGDVYPVSAEGKVVTGALVIVTMLYMAVPLGIIGSAFNETWHDRDRILLMQRTRDRLKQWGYEASDIPILFSLSDNDADGEITFHEFKTLINGMKIGFSEERIFQLFQSFDGDGSGTVDDKEFVKALFPHAYMEIYGEECGNGD